MGGVAGWADGRRHRPSARDAAATLAATMAARAQAAVKGVK